MNGRRRMRCSISGAGLACGRRGNTIVLVTAILVLLAVVATAFVSRTQASRVAAGAHQQGRAVDQRKSPILNQLADHVAQSLFVRPVSVLANGAPDGWMGGSGEPLSARSSVPRRNPSPYAVRYGVDGLDVMSNITGQFVANGDGVIDGYNFAPYWVMPWTNWPDLFSDFGGYGPTIPWPPGNTQAALDANPLGNPGFGDTRWLRSTEPARVVLQTLPNGLPREFFTHWPHLSWIPTAENGWRVCIDISDLGTSTLTDEPPRDLPLVPANFFVPVQAAPPLAGAAVNRWGLDLPYEQWLADVGPDLRWIQATGVDVAKLDPAIGWLDPDCAPHQFAQWFRQLAFGGVAGPLPPIQRFEGCPGAPGNSGALQGGWFSPDHWNALKFPQLVMPNFLQLKFFGPPSDEFVCDSPRNVITRTLADTDGDGFTDSFWFLAPASVDRSIKHVVAVSVVDNTGLLNVNVASRFDRTNTVGSTPADVALVTRLDTNNPVRADVPVGFLNNPLNWVVWPRNPPSVPVADRLPSPTTGGPSLAPVTDRQGALVFNRPLPPPGWGVADPGYPLASNAASAGTEWMDVGFNAFRWGVDGNTGAVTGGPNDPTFLREIGVLREFPNGSAQPVPTDEESPFRLSMAVPIERARYFKAMADGGRVGDYIDFQGRIHIAYGDAAPAFRQQTPMLRPFGIADEYELRARHGSNDPALISRLERAIDSNNLRFLRSSPQREETSEYFDSLTNDQLLHDNRRKITTVNGARNDMMPPWMWTLPPDTLPTRDIRLPRVSMGPAFPTEVARQAFIDWNSKLDLNEPFPADPVAFRVAQRVWLNRLANILQLSFVGQVAPNPLFPQLPVADRIFTLFGARALQPGGVLVGERLVVPWAQRLAASWAANILAARDRPVIKQQGGVDRFEVDSPLSPIEGLRVVDADTGTIDQGDMIFVGQEPQPFIAQAFFAFVYPRSRIDPEFCERMEEDGILYPGETCDNAFHMPEAFDGGGGYFVNYEPGNPAVPAPAPVLVVQIINPYNVPIDLSRFSLSAFGQRFFFGLSPAESSPASGWDYGPNPTLGPATEEGPRSAIVFACPKSLGDDPNFRAKMIAFLDLTHPWLNPSYQDPSSIVGAGNWPRKLRDELAAAQAQLGPEGINIFPFGATGGASDLFEDEATPYADTLVFNASSEDRPGSWSTDELFYRNLFDSATTAPVIELSRVVGDVLPTTAGLMENAQSIVVDRFVNQYDARGTSPSANGVVPSDQRWIDRLRRISRYDENNPIYVPPPPDSAYLEDRPERDYDAIRIGPDGLWFSTWVRAARPWVWDVNGDGAISADERSPRFAIASAIDISETAPIPGAATDAFVEVGGQRREGLVGDVAREGTAPDGQGASGELFDPNNPTRNLWMVRPRYTNPLNQSVIGKPTNFALRTVALKIADPLAAGRVRVYPPYPISPGSAGLWRHASVLQPQPALGAPVPPGYLLPNSPWPGAVGAGALSSPAEFLGDTGASLASLTHSAHRYPWRLVHRDGNFDQIAEIFDVPVYGTVIDRNGTTRATFAELMAGAPTEPAELAKVVFPELPAASMGRFAFDARRAAPNQALAIGNQFGSSPGQVPQPFIPVLPFGSSILDCVTLDAGGMRPDTGWSIAASTGESAQERLRQAVLAEDRSPRLARGYSREATPGLINVNTAPVEVLRALPNMTTLSLNEEALGDAGMPNLGSVNPQAEMGTDSLLFALPRTRVAETIVNYRDQRSLCFSVSGGLGPTYVDRGFVPANFLAGDEYRAPSEADWMPFFPGMRRGRGIAAVGELALMSRGTGWPEQPPPAVPTTPLESNVTVELPHLPFAKLAFPRTLNWAWNRSWGIGYAGADPFRQQEGDPPDPSATATAFVPPAGFGYTAAGAGQGNPSLGIAARMSTDRHPTVVRRDIRGTPTDETLLELPRAAGDQVEKNLLLKGVANLVTTRSDVFTVYVRIRSVAQNAGSGKWDATDPKSVIEDSRWVMVVDRSRVDRPGDQPEILMMQRVP